jgi:putative PIN family toxin of toxin-antitoxin system
VKRLIIDPGVLLSAFISPRRSAPALIVEAVFDGQITILACPALIAELTDVLSREKFAKHTAEGRAEAYIDAINGCAQQVEDPPAGRHRTADPDDDYLLALAEAQNADAVVSGDKHVLEAAGTEISVLTPRQLADELNLADDAPATE